MGLHHLRQFRFAGAGRDGGDRTGEDVLQVLRCAAYAHGLNRRWAVQGGIAAGGLARRLGRQKRILQVIGDLERLADQPAKVFPRVGVDASRKSPHLGGRDEQRTGLGEVIGLQVYGGFAFPGLSRADALHGASATSERGDQAHRAVGSQLARSGEGFEGEHDQAIPGQDGQRFAVRAVQAGLSTPQVCVVEGGKVVMGEAGAMDELQRGGGGVRDLGAVITAGQGHGQKDGGADAGAAGEDRMGQGGAQQRGSDSPWRRGQCARQRGFDAGLELHGVCLTSLSGFHLGIRPGLCKLRFTLRCKCEVTQGPDQMTQDPVVVIGAGMGGLSAAIRLVAAGVSVTLVEMASGPGGKARALPSVAGPVDTGPTVLTLRRELDDLFALAGSRTEDSLDLIALPRLARHFWPDGSRLDLFADRAQSEAAIAELCGPGEAMAFRRFDRLASQLYAAFEARVMASPRPELVGTMMAALRRPAIWPALLPGLSLDGLLRRMFRDPRLVQLFGRYATYVGGRPAHSPAVLALIWHAEAQGVWAVRQGLNGTAAALAKVAEGLGVRALFATRARRIVRQDGRVTGVEIEGGTTLPCAACIFAGDPGALRNGLLGDAARAAMGTGSRPRPSLSAWVWAFAARPAGVELAHHNVFFTADSAQEFGPIALGQMPASPTLYVCAQDREIGPAPIGPERFEIIMNGPAGHSPFATEEAQCRTRTFPPLAAQGLSFDPAPAAQSLTTPASLSRLYPGSGGAIYGGSPEGTMAPFRRPLARTVLPGLYLAGGGAHPGAGVPMALSSGRHAAAAVLADLTSRSMLARTVTPGGMSMPSRRTDDAPSR